MSDSSNRNFSRGGRGRNRGRAPSSGTGSWRAAGAAASTATDAGSGAPAAPSAPAAPFPAPAPAPAPTAAAGGQQAAPVNSISNNKPRQRADSHRKQPSRNSSVSAAPPPPPPITVTAPAASTAPAPAPATTATVATPQSASGRGNRKGGRSRKASVAGLAPIASSSSTLAPIASAPPNTTGFGSKASIDSLVQHMRDSVKDHSGKDDWAQDNDDSLPDLDDWDVDSKSNVSGSSNVLSVKPTPSSIKTAPIGFQGMAAQQKAAKDKLADGKKNRRGAKVKKEKGSEASPVSPQPPSPAVPAPALPPPAPRALNPTTVPAHPLAAIPPHRPPPQQVAVQLPSATIKRVVEHSPTGQTPLLPSPVFATLNPPFSGNNPAPARRSGHAGKGDWRSRDSARSGALSASASKKDLRPHHLASNSAELGAIREEILTANTVTKPKAPIEEPGHADSVVRLPSSPTGAAPPGSRGSEHGPSSSNPPSSGSSKAHNSSVPTTPKVNGGTALPGSHRRTPSTQSQTSAPHSPRQRSNQDQRDVFTASHSRTHSATRPKISVSALFQLNRSLASNGPVRPAPSQAVA